MSRFASDYEQFFTSPAGISFLTWLQEQRTNEHDKAETNPANAGWHVSTAKAYGEVLEHIDSVQVGLGRSSNGADTHIVKPD